MKKLKLSKLSREQLLNREMKEVKGGGYSMCICGCAGPSSNNDNGWANSDYGWSSPGGGLPYITISTPKPKEG